MAAVTHNGPGWARFDVTSNGAQLEAYVTMNLTSSTSGGGVLMTGAHGGGFMLTLIGGPSGPEVHVTSDALPQGVSIDQSPAASGLSGAGVIVSGWADDITVVAYAAGGVADTHATLFGDAGNTLTGSSSGTKTFMHTVSDFKGPVNVGATASLVKPGVTVGDVTQAVGGTLIGEYFAIGETNLVGVTTQQTSMTTPSGNVACGCFWMDANAAMPAGDYTFHLTYAGATFISNVFLIGADLSG